MKPSSFLRFLAFPAAFTVLPVPSALCATEPDSPYSASLRLIWGLLVVLGILFIIYGLMKRKLPFLNMTQNGVIKVVEVRHLQPKKSLYLVEIRGQEFLLGAGQDRIELISAISPAHDSKESFAEALEKSGTEVCR